MPSPFEPKEENSIDYLPLHKQRAIKQMIVREIENDQAGETEIILGNVPSKSNCYTIIYFKSKDPTKKGHPSMAKTKELKQYEGNFAIQCRKYRNANIDGWFMLHIDVYYPSYHSDLDNSLKVVLDCLQKAGAFKNDNKCARIVANRFLDKVNPRIEFYLKNMTEQQEIL